MTITISQLSGEFGYPPRVIGHLIKNFWNPTSVGELEKPRFIIPITDTETKDGWFSGEAPEIIFRHNGVNTDIVKTIGDGMFQCTYGIRIHIFATTQLQEFRYQKHINDILKDNGRNPIFKYYEDSNPNSGLLILARRGISWETAPDGDLESVQEVTHTHSLGDVSVVWIEHRT
jgi:hypothetical protein